MYDLLEEIYSTIRRNKLRTALTGFSVAWGIFMLIVLLGAGNGLLNAFKQEADDLKMNVMEIYPGYTTKAYNGLNAGRSISLDQSDFNLTRTAFPQQVDEISASSQQQGTLAYGKDNVTLSLNGVYPSYINIEAIRLKSGRFINGRDLDECRRVIVLHEETAGILFPKTQPLGKWITSQGLAYQVVGLYTDQNSFSPKAFIPFTTLQLIFNKGGKIDNLSFSTRQLDSEQANQAFEDRYRAAISRNKGFSPDDNGAIWIWNRFSQQLQQLTATRILQISIWTIGIFTLLSGIVGVSNIMLITVRERTHEFGIRKALGAKPISILRLIIAESVAITAFFGYVGLVAGVAATEYMNAAAGKQVVDAGVFSMTYFENPTVDMHIAVEATVTLIIAGTLAGLFPAIKAVKIKPIEALRAD